MKTFENQKKVWLWAVLDCACRVWLCKKFACTESVLAKFWIYKNKFSDSAQSPFSQISKQKLIFHQNHCSLFITELGLRSSVFWANRSFFAQKWANEWFAQKNERFTHSLIFGERPERFAHNCSFPLSDLSESLMVAHFWWATWAIRSHCSFLVSDLSDSLTSLTKKEEMSDSLILSKKILKNP